MYHTKSLEAQTGKYEKIKMMFLRDQHVSYKLLNVFSNIMV